MTDWPANGSNVDTWDAALKAYLDDETWAAEKDTAANWTSGDPTLAAGQVGIETDTGKWKMGDGATAWTALLYSGCPQAYGHMYAKNATIVINVGAINTAYEIASGLSGGSAAGITFGGDHNLAVAQAGLYEVIYNVSADVGSVGDEIEAGVLVNGAEAATDGGAHTIVGTAGASSNMAGVCIVALAATNEVSLYVRNHTGTNNITVEHLNCVVRRVG